MLTICYLQCQKMTIVTITSTSLSKISITPFFTLQSNTQRYKTMIVSVGTVVNDCIDKSTI